MQSHDGSIDDLLYCISYERGHEHVYAEDTYKHKAPDPYALCACITDTATRGYAALQESR